jgi:sugar-specific transcriptional regulator TrmB
MNYYYIPKGGGVADVLESLVALGLTTLEAEIYRFLLQESPATGYRIAQGLGKPTANVYKALDTLRAKSALLVLEGEPRRFRPVPVDELLDRLQRQFERHLEQSRDALRQLPGPADDDGIYHLDGRDAVLDRARQMLDRARSNVLLDVFPLPLAEVTPALHVCAERDVRVAVKVYAPARLAGVEVVLSPDHESVRRRWPVQWLNLVVDAQELMIAVLDGEGEEVLQAIWTRNAWISFILEGALAHEIAFAGVRGAAAADPRSIGDAIGRGESLLRRETPGLHRLRRLLGLVQPPDEPISPEESP